MDELFLKINRIEKELIINKKQKNGRQKLCS